jgi:class 3 adenylate cyclase
VNVSAGTYDRLKDQFMFVERGSLECKGVGVVRTYILLGE